jgi:hypothetical protein
VSALERFMNKVVKSDQCWLWVGATVPAGYGRFGPGYAHRWSYEHHVGPIAPGLEIDHLCRNRSCVNPAHLEAVTHRENMRRSDTPMGANARATHCKSGHPLTGDNLRVERNGCRRCVECRREYERQRSRRRRTNPPIAQLKESM